MTASRFSVVLGRPLGASLLSGGGLLLGLAAVGASWADLSATVAERDAKADLLSRGIAASQRAAAGTDPTASTDPFVAAETATLAAAQVDAGLRRLAISSDLVLRSSRADVKPEDASAAGDANGPGTRVEDQAIIEGQNEALQAFLVTLERGDPVILVESLAIEPAEVDQGAMSDPQAPRLRMTLTVSAFWRSGRTATAAAVERSPPPQGP